MIALAAFIDVVLRLLEFVATRIRAGRVGEIGDRENRLENGLKPFVRTPALGLVDQKELVVGCLLNLDEVRHFCDFANGTEGLAYACGDH
jgi:hypothetical protein